MIAARGELRNPVQLRPELPADELVRPREGAVRVVCAKMQMQRNQRRNAGQIIEVAVENQ